MCPVAYLRTIMSSFQHDRAVAELLHQAVFALNRCLELTRDLSGSLAPIM